MTPYRNKKFSVSPTLNAVIQAAKAQGVIVTVSSDDFGNLIVNAKDTNNTPLFGSAWHNTESKIINFINEKLPIYGTPAPQSNEFDLFA